MKDQLFPDTPATAPLPSSLVKGVRDLKATSRKNKKWRFSKLSTREKGVKKSVLT